MRTFLLTLVPLWLSRIDCFDLLLLYWIAVDEHWKTSVLLRGQWSWFWFWFWWSRQGAAPLPVQQRDGSQRLVALAELRGSLLPGAVPPRARGLVPGRHRGWADLATQAPHHGEREVGQWEEEKKAGGDGDPGPAVGGRRRLPVQGAVCRRDHCHGAFHQDLHRKWLTGWVSETHCRCSGVRIRESVVDRQGQLNFELHIFSFRHSRLFTTTVKLYGCLQSIYFFKSLVSWSLQAVSFFRSLLSPSQK